MIGLEWIATRRPRLFLVGAVSGDEPPERFDGEPGDGEPVVDRGVAERFEQVALAGAGGSDHGEVLRPPDPLEGAQCLLGRGRDG